MNLGGHHRRAIGSAWQVGVSQWEQGCDLQQADMFSVRQRRRHHCSLFIRRG
jgi:hypothetical protein